MTQMRLSKTVFLSIFLFGVAFYAFTQSDGPNLTNMEIKTERNINTKVFLSSGGDKQAVICAGPVHYQSNGNWEDISTTLVQNENGYENVTNIIESYFPLNTAESGMIKLVVNSSDEIFIHSSKKLIWYDPTNLSSEEFNSNSSIAKVDDNMITYPEILPGISDEFIIRNGQIKNNVVLNSLPEILTNRSVGYFGFQETIELPMGWKITIVDSTTGSFTSSSLHILDLQGEHVLTIPTPIFFDDDGSATDGSNIVIGKFLLSSSGNMWNISTLIPVEWLKNDHRKYPVSIDPSVVIPGTTGGWQSPNNWVDNSSFVFIGVCCGNLTHRAWIKFNTTAIPDGTCIQSVELQVNVYTEANAIAELTQIMDVTGAFGPYGAIVPAAYNDFGTGFYTSFTITGTGNYGYYTLGASANALLQAQLPVNWFQPALMFNNEPSTNYKNIDALQSNLRVTYPCALPVELMSFDANCSDDRVSLNWSTASEINNKHFMIGKSTDGVNYEVIGTLSGAGNSNQQENYSFVDPQPSEGISYYYLKQTDYDGTEEYLDLVTINCHPISGINIYPNPNNGIFVIEGAQPGDQILITDVVGSLILQSLIVSEKMEINLKDRVNGPYFVQIISGSGTVSQKMIINK